MGRRDRQVDQYISKSADFARPILRHLRDLVHRGCPQAEEAIKWGMPNFVYKGILCNMASFTNHCAFGFWKGKLIFGDKMAEEEANAMGSFGKIRSLEDLPPDKTILSYIKKAAKLNDEGIKTPVVRKAGLEKESKPPQYFMTELKKNKKAFETFQSFSPSNKREYVSWIVEAKSEETRKSRMEKAIEWMAEGKPRNWKYMK